MSQREKNSVFYYRALSEMKKIEQTERIQKWLEATAYDPSEKIREMTDIYNKIGVGEICLRKIENLYAAGLQILDDVKAPEERKEQLIAFSRQLMKRKM